MVSRCGGHGAVGGGEAEDQAGLCSGSSGHLPLCGGCTRETRFADKFCAACGAACDDRAKVRIAKRRGVHVYVPALAHLKASDVKRELVDRCGGSVAADS